MIINLRGWGNCKWFSGLIWVVVCWRFVKEIVDCLDIV